MTRTLTLWLALVVSIAAIALTQERQVSKVSRVEGIRLLDQRIEALTQSLSELRGMRNAWVLTDADSVYYPQEWVR
jgi:hypothetical protein